MPLQKIEITLRNLSRIIVDAEVYGDYAVHPTLLRSGFSETLYSVTHIKSGYLVAETDVLDDARGFAQEMASINVDAQVKSRRQRQSGTLLKTSKKLNAILTKYHMYVIITQHTLSGRKLIRERY